MTKRVGDVIVFEEEPNDICEFCKKECELRPYGPNGERVCFECAMKDEQAALRQFSSRILGESTGH